MTNKKRSLRSGKGKPEKNISENDLHKFVSLLLLRYRIKFQGCLKQLEQNV